MPPSIQDLVCFSVYTAERAVSQAYREVLSPWGLSYTQFLVLLVLHGGERSVSAVGEELDLDSGTLSPLIGRLEARGLVSRSRDASDGRVVRVRLTEEGLRIHAALSGEVECLAPALADSAASAAAIVAQLQEMTGRLRRLTEDHREAAAA